MFHYSAIARSDVLIVLSQDGAAMMGERLAAMRPGDRVFAAPDVVELESKAQGAVIDPVRAPGRLGPGRVALYRAARVLQETA